MSPSGSPTIDIHLTEADLRTAMEHDVRAGLTAVPKQLPPVYFYDDRGSRLFDDITRLPEYYPTRAERSILEAHARDMADRSGADTLVELGAGTCDKSRVLLDAGSPPEAGASSPSWAGPSATSTRPSADASWPTSTA